VENLLVLQHPHHPERLSLQICRAGKEFLHPIRMRTGGDVYILGFSPQQFVQHRTSDKIRLVSGLLQGADDGRR